MSPQVSPANGFPGWWMLLILPALGALAALGVLLAVPGPAPEATSAAPVAQFPSPPPIRFETPTPRPTVPPVPTALPPMVGESAADLAFSLLDGETLRLADLHGQIVFLNVWATWCAPCRDEMPELQHLHEALGEDGVTVIAVTDPADGQTLDAIRAFVDDFDLTLRIALESDPAFFRRFGVQQIPMTFIIDQGGIVRFAHLGELHDHDMADYLAALAS